MHNLKDYFLRPLMRIKYNLKNITEEDICEEYILINSPEIVKFIKKNCGMLDLINDSFSLINKYYPNCPVYLVFEEDCEEDGKGCIFALVISEDLSFEENYKLFESFYHDFYGIKGNYFKSYLNFNMDFRSDSEYYEQWRLDELNNRSGI